MSDNWIVQNLNSALQTWSDKLAEIWTLLTQSPENFKGGAIWSVMTNINGGLRAIGYGLLVLFFAAGLVKTCGSFTDMKKAGTRSESLYPFCTGTGSRHVRHGTSDGNFFHCAGDRLQHYVSFRDGRWNGNGTASEIVDKIEAVGMLESIPL